MPDESGLTEVALEWETDVPTIEIAYAGSHTDVFELFGEVVWYRRGLGLNQDDGTTDGPPLTLKHLADFADGIRLRAFVRWGAECDGSADVVSQIAAPIPESFALDDAVLMPRLSDATIDLSSPARPIMTWKGDSESADGIYVNLYYEDVNLARTGSWVLALPPGTNEFRLPALPASVPEWVAYRLPTADSAFDPCYASVASVDGNFIDGYEDFRRSYFFGYWDSYHLVEGQSFSHTYAGFRRVD